MNTLAQVFLSASRHARGKRDAVFRSSFPWIGPETRILDLGSEDGANIARVLAGLPVTPANVHAADVNAVLVARARERFGFTPVLLDESGALPFPDSYFDLVYCSSVIEHVTLPKAEIWSEMSGRIFRERSLAHQSAFAQELRRVAQAYFVQTPNVYFPVESHTWLPFVGYLPRRLLIPALRITNRVWIKRTAPDWNLLRRNEMAALFPDAEVVPEKSLGLAKSWMAIRVRRVTALLPSASPHTADAPAPQALAATSLARTGV